MHLRNLLMGGGRAGSVSLMLCALGSAAATGAEGASRESLAHAEMLRNRALTGTSAMAIVTSLTTEVGPRLAGSEAEARAREWALQTLTAKGFAGVRSEPFEMDAWQRHDEGAEIIAPYPQPLAVTALGGIRANAGDRIVGRGLGF